ncbi:6-phosphogluconate dehydrogenase, decarboxylating [Sphingomonas antarctica]|uniref:phosphogluconate dehydrogenase (NAD(+)-dependent, decarboxylating) n=1 Tax=Sphingomonas antarctica TaxID=2040274 RepID=UPI0039ED7FD8
MQLAVIGLGRMGANIGRRLMRGGHQIVGFDRNQPNVDELAGEGATGASSLEDVVANLASPKIVWVMLPAGDPTEQTIQALIGLLSDGDIIIDGGNSFYRDDIRRSKDCAAKGIHYVDVGTSGGVWGLERGFCMMIGASDDAFTTLDPVFDCLAPGYGTVTRTKGRNPNDTAPERGYLHAGPPGSGHFVKMVHNGIEYGLMQAYAEGFDVMKSRSGNKYVPEDERFDLNLTDIAEVWRRGSVISSWLLDLQASALAGDQMLEKFSGKVADSGEGHWTINAAMEQGTPVNVLAASLFARYRSRTDGTFGDKLLSAMRFGFGGHVEMPQ